ncbi:SULT1 [Mytilus edulis]|uniref:SULT1 n=1 Tax=Mytilus edulis TaxID=6550 RepID=A0A8S3VL91_MYTED|nr:SULT1 [Mytilus edulis]
MPLTDLTDSDGNHFKVLEVDGYYLPNFGYDSQESDFQKRVEHWQARDDDIMICNYPKSGTHWIWEIVQMLYRQQAEFVNVTKDDWMIECITKEKFDGLTSPRILNSHLYHSMLPQDFLSRKCKIIYTIRNPKDVAVSFYHHHRNILMYEYTGSWNSYIERFLKGEIDYKSWFDYVRDWCKVLEENKDYPIHVINYEDMHTNNIKEIKRLAEFLCIKCEDQLIGEIGTKCQIENMKREKIQNNEDWRDNTAGMYREGKVGGWKNVFTVTQNELFDEVYDKKMAGVDMNLRFNL